MGDLTALSPGEGRGEVGDLPAAYGFYKQSLALFQELDDQQSSATCLEGWGAVVTRQGQTAWAAQLWGAAEARRAAGGPCYPPDPDADAAWRACGR